MLLLLYHVKACVGIKQSSWPGCKRPCLWLMNLLKIVHMTVLSGCGTSAVLHPVPGQLCWYTAGSSEHCCISLMLHMTTQARYLAIAAKPMILTIMAKPASVLQAVESQEVFQEHMMQACCKEPLLGMLHSLGTELGIHVWRDYQSQTEPSPLPDPVPGRAHEVEHTPQPVMEAEPMLPADPQPSSYLESMESSPSVQSFACETLNMVGGTASASEQTLSPQEYIEHICLTFGEGAEVTPEAAAAIKRANAMVGRSAKMLSVDLYAEKTHFMQELVQNADDCRYPPGVRPTADFVFEDNCITLHVNEVNSGACCARTLTRSICCLHCFDILKCRMLERSFSDMQWCKMQ